MKKTFFTISLAILATLLFAFNSQAQSLAKNWVVDDLKIIIPDDATDEEKEQFEMMEGFLAMAVQELKGSMRIEFDKNGTYIAYSEEEGKKTEETGTWDLDGEQLSMQADEGGEEQVVTIELEKNEMRFVIEEEGATMHMVFIPY